ncbi:MAG: hypothetical protein VKL42_20905 [Snowella sp.]|nr:hypothetical protein [Snowella sp.]
MANSTRSLTQQISAIAALVGWIKERNPTMGNDNLIVGYCDYFIW